MFGSAVLEVGIGLTFFYLLLSMMCSAINEWISGLLALRGENLRRGIANLLHDREKSGASDSLYSHPLIKSLAKPSRSYTFLGVKQRRPSYIPPKIFASVLLDLLVDRDAGKHELDILGLIKNVSDNDWMNEDLKRTLRVFANEAGNNLDEFRTRIEDWYVDCMERVSGWYKRRTQAIIFGIAVSITVAINADTITVADTLWNNTALRTKITYLAETAVSPKEPGQGPNAIEPSPEDVLKKAETNLRESALGLKQFPLGWNGEPKTANNVLGLPDGLDWLTKIVGLMVTVFSVSLGAPFWFDLLGKVIEVRSSIQSDAKGTRKQTPRSSDDQD